MRFEIITDKTNLLVLVVNGEVIEISRSMSKILDKVQHMYDETTTSEIMSRTVAENTRLFGL